MPRVQWPNGVHIVTVVDMNRLGIDGDSRLYWDDGKPVAVQRRLILSFRQKLAACILILAAIAGGLGGAVQGLNAGHDFACKQAWVTSGCRQ